MTLCSQSLRTVLGFRENLDLMSTTNNNLSLGDPHDESAFIQVSLFSQSHIDLHSLNFLRDVFDISPLFRFATLHHSQPATPLLLR